MISHNTRLRKKISFLLLCMALVLPAMVHAQLTVTVGSGSSSGSSDGPIYRSAASSSFDYSSYHYLFTQSELSNAGLIPGVALTDVAWYKTNTTHTNGPAVFSIWVKNSTLTSVQSTPQTYTNITNGATQVYNTNNQTFGSTSGWQNFTFDNVFVYTGSALEVTIFWDISGVSGSPTNGSFIWKRDYVSNRTIGYTSSVNGSSFNSSKSTRAQTRFTYVDCIAPGNLNATNITTNSADVSWGASNNAIGYEYVVDQSPNAPTGSGTATAATSASVSGLTLNTNYYLHVRCQCDVSSFSTWATYSFMTNDAYCKPPSNILYSNITPHSADVLWGAMPTSDSYEYILDTSPNPVLGSANATPTTGIFAQFTGLMPETKYYLFIRSICLGGNDISFWAVDSFMTLPECRAPNLNTTITGNTVDAWWNEVPAAVAYGYAVTTSEAPPAYGQEIYDTVLSVAISDENVDQFLHVRSKCNSQFTFSEWSTEQVKFAIATGINTTSGNSQLKLYPNPVKGELFVSGAKGSEVVVMDMKGVVLQSATIDMDKYAIDCSAFAPGLYIIDIRGQYINKRVQFSKMR
jgi:hypothetical protein